jgi:hypothetical protein
METRVYDKAGVSTSYESLVRPERVKNVIAASDTSPGVHSYIDEVHFQFEPFSG